MELRNRNTHRSFDFWQRFKGNAVVREYSFQQMVLKQLYIHMKKQKNKEKVNSHITLYTNIITKQVIDLNTKPTEKTQEDIF